MAPAANQPGEITNIQLKISYWYISHQLQLKKILTVFLIILSAALYGFSLYQAVNILILQRPAYLQSIASLASTQPDYPAFHQRLGPKNLEVLTVNTVGGLEGRYDYVARVRNPNPNFFAQKIQLQLLSGNQVTAEKNEFILPGEEKYIGFFGQAGGTQAAINLAKVSWKRYYNYQTFADVRLRFKVSDAVFKSAVESGIKGQLPVSTLNFKITNTGAFGFWHVGVMMVLLNGGQVVGANYTALDQFKSGETRSLEMRWYEPLPAVSDVKIMPAVDILDPGIYLPVE